MRRAPIVRLALLVGFVVLGAPPARGVDPASASSGEGARPNTGFDPTGSHPLPNEGVDQRRSRSGCGC